jgi:hypothetical protein
MLVAIIPHIVSLYYAWSSLKLNFMSSHIFCILKAYLLKLSIFIMRVSYIFSSSLPENFWENAHQLYASPSFYKLKQEGRLF